MPYIKKDDRFKFDSFLEEIAKEITTEGEMNYCFFKIIQQYVKKVGKNYKNLAMCISALENCKLEVYRRIVGPYEDEKIKENGDVE